MLQGQETHAASLSLPGGGTGQVPGPSGLLGCAASAWVPAVVTKTPRVSPSAQGHAPGRHPPARTRVTQGTGSFQLGTVPAAPLKSDSNEPLSPLTPKKEKQLKTEKGFQWTCWK